MGYLNLYCKDQDGLGVDGVEFGARAGKRRSDRRPVAARCGYMCYLNGENSYMWPGLATELQAKIVQHVTNFYKIFMSRCDIANYKPASIASS